MRNKDVISYLGLWESIHNENFKGVEFDTFKNEVYQNKIDWHANIVLPCQIIALAIIPDCDEKVVNNLTKRFRLMNNTNL